MFFKNLFNRKRLVSIHDIHFQPGDWQLRDRNAGQVTWIHPNYENAALLSLHYFGTPPDLPCTLANVEKLQQFYLGMVTREGAGLLQAEPLSIGALEAFSLLIKTPAQPSGMLYVGSLTIPFRDCSFVLKIQAVERGVTGVREATIAQQLLAAGTPVNDKGIEGWDYYPYGVPGITALPANRSEEARYDDLFPQHPLSFVRREMAALLACIGYEKQLERLDPFRP